MQTESKHGKLLTVKDGYLICPVCRRNRHLQRIDAVTTAEMLPAYCRSCKNEIYIDIAQGQCYESRSQ